MGTDGGITNPNTNTNDQFGMELKYDNAATPQYNGNIGSTAVKTTALSGTSTIYPALVYNYAYDKLNRLINAISSTASPTANDNFYNENVTYDVMGNITKLNRYDKPSTSRVAIDSLTYSYVSGNKVARIDELGTSAGFTNNADQAGEYTYDGNGNQLTDLNKGLTQAYNMLNLPQTAVRSGISVAYIYDATGRKLRKLATMGSTTTVTEYASGVQYDYTGTLPKISFIQTEEGRARKNGIVYKYEYDLKDHLGNTRLTTTWNPSDANQLTPLNLQRNDYYAFGATIQSLIGTTPNPSNHYLYNHKELQDETGLYDYGARFYDPVVARWTTVDKLDEHPTQIDLSPYAYVGNNPILKDDPDGNCPLCWLAELAVEVYEGATAVHVATAGAIFVAGGTAVVMHNINSGSQDTYSPAPDNTRVTSSVPRITPAILSAGTSKGQKNPTSNGARETGQEAHRQKQKEAKEQGHDVEVPIELPDGTKVRKDVVEKDGTPVIIKPDTKSGRKSAEKREELLKKNGYNGTDKPLPKTDLYNPNDPVYQPGSPTYIGPKVKS